jgi:hypothetical protein
MGGAGYVLAPFLALFKIGSAASSILFHRLETKIKYDQRGYPKNYLVIAHRAEHASTASLSKGEPVARSTASGD